MSEINEEDFVRATVSEIGFADDKGAEGTIVLRSEGGLVLAMRAFSGEVALHISRFSHGDRSSIPSVFNIIETLAESIGTHLQRVFVYSSGSALRADLEFGGKTTMHLRGYRASDAIALAIFYDAPIRVHHTLLKPETEAEAGKGSTV